MVERVLFGPGGATEAKQDDIIDALAGTVTVELDAATLAALETINVAITAGQLVGLDATTLTALENIVVSGTVALDAPTLAALESITVAGTVALDAPTLAALETITAAVSNFPAEYPLPAAQITTLTPQTNALTDTQLRASAVPVSAASLPLPAGAATAANQSSEQTLVGAVNETAPGTDTASSGLNGRLQRIAQRLTSLIALLPTSLGQKAKAASLAVTLASDQDALPVTDNGGSLTVDGTVAVSGSALPTGAATLAEQQTQTASLSVLDDWDESDRAKVNVIAGQAGVQGGQGAVTASTQRVAIATDANAISVASLPLPSGAATSAAQTDKSQFTKITDGTDTALVTAAGEQNVIATAQPGVDIGDVTINNATGASAVNVQDGGNSLTVDAPLATPVNVQIGNATLAAGVIDETGSGAVDALAVGGGTAHDAVDSGNPVKFGGKVATSTPTPVADGDRVNAWFDSYGRQIVSDQDIELGNNIGSTGLRDRLMAQRYTVLADSLADGLAGFWTSATANGGTATSSGGEGLLQTSANATGSAQITSTVTPYFPGQVGWFNSAVRFNDTGSAGNIRRIGVFTVSGTTPQDGFYYELSGTTLNAVVVKGGVATATASTSWSRVAIAPFTLDTSYHSFEIRFTANTVWFYVDNVLRHVVSGTTAAITATLNFPITITSVNTSGASNRLIAVRNCGIGRFGNPEQPVSETGLSAVLAVAVGGGTPHDSVDSGNPVKFGGYAKAAAPTSVADGDRVNAWFTQSGALNIALPTALPAGTNNIGDVDVLTVASGTALTATHTSDNTVTNSSEALLASNGSRKGFVIQNTHTSEYLRIKIAGTPTATDGLQVAPGESFAMMSTPNWGVPTGAINGIRQGSNDVTVSVIEFT